MVQLVIKLRRQQWLLQVVVVGALFVIAVAIISACSVSLATVPLNRTPGPDQLNDLVSRYNAYSGFIMSIADEPLVVGVKAFVPVWVALVLSPLLRARNDDDTMRVWTHRARQFGCAMASVGIAAAVTNAVASLNVQHLSTSVEACMGDSDAAVTMGASMAPENSNSSVNTIFRPFIAPQKNLSLSSCSYPIYFAELDDEQNWYDLRYQPFFRELVPIAVVPDASSSFSVNTRDGIKHNGKDQQSPFSISTANELLALAARLFGNAPYSQARQLVQEENELALGAFVSLALNVTKNATDTDRNTTFFVHEQANITFRRVTLASGVVFDAVTIELQHTPEYTANMVQTAWVKTTPNSDDKTVTETNARCGSVGCYLHQDEASVRAYQLCEFSDALSGNRGVCDHSHNGQLIVASKGTKVRAKKVFARRMNTSTTASTSAAQTEVVIRGLQLFSTVTVGLLRWQVRNLARMYDVPCDDEAGSCMGIAYNVSQTNATIANESKATRAILASPDSIRSTDLPPLLDAQPTYLANIYASIPLRLSDVEDTSGWRNLEGEECSILTDGYLSMALSNHMYSDESFQAAYTGGMYFLFQNGRAIERIPDASDQRQGFAFAGSKRTVELRASVPSASAVISITSVVTLVAFTVMISSGAQRVRNGATRDVRAAQVVEVLVNNQRFPKSLLHCQLENTDSRHQLAALEIAALQLKSASNELLVLDRTNDAVNRAITELSESAATAFKDSTQWRAPIPLVIALRRTRLVVVAVILAVTYVVLLVQLLNDGLWLATVPYDEETVRQHVQDYSFYSGTLGAMLTAPAEMLISTLVPVVSLAMPSSSQATVTALVGLKLVAIWSLTTAINSVNVQSGAVDVESRMSSADFAASIPTSGKEPNVAEAWANNTVLRSLINGVVPPETDFKCSRADFIGDPVHPIRNPPFFAFTPRPWHKAFFPRQIDAMASAEFTNSSDIVGRTDLPVDPAIAVSLIRTTAFLSREKYSPLPFQDKLYPPDNYRLKLSRYQLTPDVDFHVVTETWDAESATNVNDCSAGGCVVGLDVSAASSLVVRMDSLCKVLPEGNCSNGLVVSADYWEHRGEAIELLPGNHSVQIVEGRARSAKMWGMLRWHAIDLAKRYGATCGAESKTCMGLSFPLEGNASQVLLLDEQRLQRNFSRARGDLIRLNSRVVLTANFDRKDWDDDYFQGNHCAPVVESAVKYAQQNHLYQDRGAVEYVSYFAAMLYLLDEARTYDVIPVAANSTTMTLDFDNNTHNAHIGATIPKQAAVVSVVATSIILCLALHVVVVELLSERDETSPPRGAIATSVHGVAEVMHDGTHYPKSFLSAEILLTTDKLHEKQHAKRVQSLDELKISGVTLEPRDGAAARTQLRWKCSGTRVARSDPQRDPQARQLAKQREQQQITPRLHDTHALLLSEYDAHSALLGWWRLTTAWVIV